MNVREWVQDMRYSVAIELTLRGQAGKRVCWPLFYLGMQLGRIWGRVVRWARRKWLPSERLTVSELAGLDPDEC